MAWLSEAIKYQLRDCFTGLEGILKCTYGHILVLDGTSNRDRWPSGEKATDRRVRSPEWPSRLFEPHLWSCSEPKNSV